MTDGAALLAGIWDDPHDDVPRLVYADWLEETGEAANVARAEFIRLQCRLARAEDDDPAAAQLARRAETLRKRHGGTWKAGLPSFCQNAVYDRGFPYPTRTVRVCRWNHVPGEAWDAVPLCGLNLTQHSHKAFDTIPDSPHLLRVGVLDLRPGEWRERQLHPADLARLAASPNVRNVTTLKLSGNWLGAAAGAVFDSAGLPHLAAVDLEGCGATGAVIGPLLASSFPERLTHLGLAYNNLTADDLRPLFAAAGRFARLWLLNLCGNTLAPAGYRALADSPPFPALRSLKLDPREVTDAAVEALANWPGLATVRELWLTGLYTGVGPGGARALAASPHLGGLRRLRCTVAYDGQLESRDTLRKRFGDAFEG